MLKIKNIKKSYGDINALKGISFEVKKGEIFGLLGPNGAGKTTAISILTSLLDSDSGEAYYEDKNIFNNIPWWRKKIGVVPQEIAFYEELTARENLTLWGTLYGMNSKEAKDRASYLLKLMGLESKEKAKVSEFSGGMKRRLNIAIGIVHKPEVLFLDEPTVGIDVQARVNIREILKKFINEDMTIIYTTHQLEEAEELCDRIAIMDEGEIKAQGTLKELISQLGEETEVEFTGSFSEDKIKNVFDNKGIKLLKFSKETILIDVEKEDIIPELVELLMKNNVIINTMDIKRPNLETLFLKLTGKELRE
jgi:ABC-2 type transport system ATP-binding protein